jgi:tRNA(Ile)-lysidine synthase
VAFGWRFRAESGSSSSPALIRSWRPGDRVTLRYSSGPRKIKDVLERLKVTGTERMVWPVIEWQGGIVWMQGAELQPTPAVSFFAEKE